MMAFSFNKPSPEDPHSISGMLGAEGDNRELVESYALFKKFIESNRGTCNSKDAECGKENPDYERITKLTVGHLFELTCDIRDEVIRRENEDPEPLPAVEEYSDKRNNARRKLSSFSTQKIHDYCLNIMRNLERRNIIKPLVEPEAIIETAAEQSKVAVENIVQNELSPAKSAVSAQTPPSLKRARTSEQPTPLRLPTLVSGLCRLDSLSTMIDDFDSFIEDDECEDSDDIQALKLKHAQEILELKQIINKYENILIPEKNKEVARLVAMIEEAELKAASLSNQVASLRQQLKARDNLIEDCRASYNALSTTLQQIQQNLTDRTRETSNSAKVSFVQELKETIAFGELKKLNVVISGCIPAAVNAIKTNNVKVCLKQLKDLATATKSSIILMDRIFEAFKELNITDLISEGEEYKSALIQSSSELLVVARDYRSNSANSGSVLAALNAFERDHGKIQSFQELLKTCVQEL